MNFGIRREAVVSRQRDQHIVLISNAKKGIEKHAQVAIQTQYLIVYLSRVGAITVANRIGSRQRDGEDIGPWAGTQTQRPYSGEREVEGDLVHPGKLRQEPLGGIRDPRFQMRE